MKNVGKKVIQKALLDWYQCNHRELPWRRTNNPYHIWVSEVMAQQTRVETVIPYYRRFIQRFPDINTLAAADRQDVLKMWEGLGYYRRVHHLHQAARFITDRYKGEFPKDFADIVALPGVGEYIAAAIASIAFSQPFAVLDGNVKRVLSRLYCVDKATNDPTSQRHYQTLAGNMLDGRNPGNHNQALMELGAIICRPTNPVCGKCPVGNCCCAHQSGRVEDYPRRISKKEVPTYHIAVGVIHKNGKLLITQREETGLLGGLWEFPGGKMKDGESAESACRREILEETGLTVKIERFLTQVRHAYSHFKIEVDVFICDYIRGEVQLKGSVDFRWVGIEELDRFPFPKANHKFIPLLKQLFG